MFAPTLRAAMRYHVKPYDISRPWYRSTRHWLPMLRIDARQVAASLPDATAIGVSAI